MNQIRFFPLLFLAVLSFAQYSCDNDSPLDDNSEWLVATSDILDGGPGKDGIPSVDNPNFSSINDITNVTDSELVIGIKVGNEIKAYPHAILDWHEIVNDEVGNKSVAITYCPLTGTAIGWDRMINGSITEYGVSGLLFNTNLMPYDRQSNSTWSQMRLDCVNGELIGEAVKTVQVLETEYGTWKALYPNSLVLNRNTGINRTYGEYPYGDYKTSNRTIFPLLNEDDRLPLKERVLGIQGITESKAYRFKDFNDGEKVVVINDELEGKQIVVFGSQEGNFIVAFENKLNGTIRNFVSIERAGQVIAEDESGNKYDLFGEVIEGPDTGAKLDMVNQYIGYWLGWGSFHPGISIWE